MAKDAQQQLKKLRNRVKIQAKVITKRIQRYDYTDTSVKKL